KKESSSTQVFSTWPKEKLGNKTPSIIEIMIIFLIIYRVFIYKNAGGDEAKASSTTELPLRL
ncbi:MAG: hypothetical protein Q8N87_03535, partial [bacterium]|nr:hypothetical protein [bacterium]